MPQPWPTFPILSRALERGRTPPERKVRLFTVACCRDLWGTLSDDPAHEAIAVEERYADGLADEGEHRRAIDMFMVAALARNNPRDELALLLGGTTASPFRVAAFAEIWSRLSRERYKWRLQPATNGFLSGLWRTIGRWTGAGSAHAGTLPLELVVAMVDADRFLSRLATDVFRHHLVPVVFDPAWRTEAVVALAHGMYESRDFSTMPVLADALDDAGCDHPDILAHCRTPGLHVRGCWVVDLVLGKS